MPAARMPLTGRLAALALLAGAGLALSLPVAAPAWMAVAVALCAIALGIRAHRLRLVGMVLAGFAMASLHAQHALDARLSSTPARQDDVVVGRVATLPRTEPTRVVFDLDIEEARAVRAGRRVRVSWYYQEEDGPPLVRAGERWRLGLRLKAPRGLRNPGAADAERHAFADRLAATGYVRGDATRRLDGPRGLQAWRERVSARIGKAVPNDSSRFVRALALGDTRWLGERDWLLLRANGLTHLIAISGFHVGMVAGAAALLVRLAWWLLPGAGRRLPARVAAGLAGVAAAAAYAAAAGFSMPTVRTLVMIAAVALALLMRRALGVSQALALAAGVIVLVDPLALLGAGFWLSFAGVAWLAWCLPRERVGALRGLVLAQAVASLGLLPLTVFLFGQASVAGPFANLLAVPLWSLVVAPLAVFGVAVDALHPGLASFAWRTGAEAFDLAWPLFEAMGSSPLALRWIPEPSAWALPLACIGAAWLLLPRGAPARWLGVPLMLPLLWPASGRPAEGEAEVTAVDVGQGLAVLVRTRSHALLYDTGPAVPDGFDAGERAVVPVIRARAAATRLDRLILSHADNDHAGGLDAVRAEIPVAGLVAPEGAGVAGTAACLAGQAWTWDGVRFTVLHPAPHFPYLGNESSCVVRIDTAHGSVLLTGDIGEVIERRLVADQPQALRADVVFPGHHGSRHSSDPAFVAATGARHAIFSTGHGNRYGHPAAEVQARWRAAGAAISDTAQSGAVTVRLGHDGIGVRGQRETSPRLWDAARIAERSAGLSYRAE